MTILNGDKAIVIRAESAPAAGSHTWKLQANAVGSAGSVSIRTAVLAVSEV